jgi:hypothetical protein
MWGLSQIRPVLGAQALKRIEARLEELNAHSEAPGSASALSMRSNRQLAD